jgi:hypothetical protein
MAIVLEQRPVISEGDVDVVSIDYTPYLDSSEVLTGTPVVTPLGVVTSFDDEGDPQYAADNDDLAITNKVINSGAIVRILKKDVAINKAVQFKVAGQQAGYVYGVRISVSTTSSPARTKVVDVLLTCSE